MEPDYDVMYEAYEGSMYVFCDTDRHSSLFSTPYWCGWFPIASKVLYIPLSMFQLLCTQITMPMK
jgi:hypothetical protein